MNELRRQQVGLKVEFIAKRALIVDGYYGHVYVSPSRALLTEFKSVQLRRQDVYEKIMIYYYEKFVFEKIKLTEEV